MKLKQNPKERVLDGLAFMIHGVVTFFVILVGIAIICAGFGLIAYMYTQSEFGRNTVIFVSLTTIALGSVVLLAEAYFWSLTRIAKREDALKEAKRLEQVAELELIRQAAVQEGATDESA